MTITELAIKRPILILVCFAALAIVGVYSFFQLNYELLPDVTPPHVSIITTYPGASPNEVETSLSKPIEDAASNVEKVKRVFSTSTEGVSMVWIEFRQSADADIALQMVQRRINEIADQLPLQARKPVLSKFSLSEFPILRIAATSTAGSKEFYQDLKDRIRPRLAQLPGVGAVTLIGGEEREIKVYLNAKLLQAQNLSPLQVVDMLRRSDIDLPAGKIKDTDGEYDVRLTGRLQTLDELRTVTVGYGPDGRRIPLCDVAEVMDGTRDDAVISRLNTQPAVAILIQKQTDANSVEVSRLARNELRLLEQEYASMHLKFDVAQDLSEFTMESATAVVQDLFVAVLLVALVMLVFLHSLRNAFIVLVAIPASLISVTGVMYALGFTLNIMTLLAMSLVIGILVDDSIVVLENIHTHLQRKKDPHTAALDGRLEIGFTALAITLVDVVVFVPASLLGGVVGGLLKQFSIVIVIATLMSLLVSFTLTPMLASRLSRIEDLKNVSWTGRFADSFELFFQRILRSYEGILRWALLHRGSVALTSAVLFIGSLCLVGFGFIGSEFVSMADKGEFTLTMTLPPGAALATTDSLVHRAEAMIAGIPEVKKIFASVGVSNEGFIGMTSSNNAEIIVSLVPKARRSRSMQEIGSQIKNAVLASPGVKARIVPIGFLGTANDAPIQILINGTNRDSLKAAGDIMLNLVQKIPGTSDVRLSVEEGRPETRIEIDREKLALFRLSLEDIATALRVRLTGYGDNKFREGTTEYLMNIVLDETDKSATAGLAGTTFVNSRGQSIELRQFARVYQSTGPSKLDRRNRMPAITLFSEAVGRPAGTIGDDIQAALATTRLPEGIKTAFEGDLEMQEEGFDSILLALIAAIVFVYLIMAALYDSLLTPFVVLFSIPVAVIGALLALALTMNTLNIFSFFGIVIMVGLVSKNAILLIDRANHLRSGGMDVMEALVQAGQHRLRPILMTTMTMVFGMMPIAIATGPASEWKSGLALGLIGGLTTSMFLTLILVPTMYVDVERFKNYAAAILRHWSGGKRMPVTAGSLLLCALAAALSTPLHAQERPLTAADAVTLAMEKNAQIRIASLEVRRASEAVREAWGGLLPALSAEGTYTRYMKLPVMFFPTIAVDPANGSLTFTEPSVAMEMGAKNEFLGSINASLPLFRGDVYAGIRAANARERMSVEDVRAGRADVVAAVKKTYYTILLLREQRTVVAQSIARSGEILSEARNLFRQGFATDVDTLQAFVAAENQQPILIRLDNAIASTTTMLKTLIGLPSDNPIVLTDSLDFSPVRAASYDTAYATVLTMRPDVLKLSHQLQAAEALKQMEWSGHLPALSFFCRVQAQDQQNDFAFSRYTWPISSMAGLQLSVPLFNGFRTDARVQQAEVVRLQTEAAFDQTKDAARAELQIALGSLAEAKRRLASSGATVQAAERSYQKTRSRWQQGMCRQIDVSEANVMFNQAKFDRLQAITDCLIAETELAKAAGVLVP
jgi:hydrophobe/amphiphile efflux-1 (HAE1) family protein